MRYIRKGFVFLLILVTAMLPVLSLADSLLPDAVAELFTVKSWAHYTIAAQSSMPEGKAFAVAADSNDGYEAVLLVMRNTQSKTNVLVMAEKASVKDSWKITMRNWAAVGSGDEAVPMIYYTTEHCFVLSYPDGNTAMFARKNKHWELTQLTYGDSTVVHVAKNGLTFEVVASSGKLTKTTVSGVVETSMAQFSMSRFPKTVAKAREKLTNPPTVPNGAALGDVTGEYAIETSEYASLPAGKQYAVYSAPSEESYRAANGKALLSTNDWVQVLCEENGYLMVQYAISSKQYRIGYITADALKDKSNVNVRNRWANYDATVTNATALTDDPLNSCDAVMKLSQGTSVTYLGHLGSDWAYIETITSQGKTIRGFVPLEDLTVSLPDDNGSNG
jgi:hypothetical protein